MGYIFITLIVLFLLTGCGWMTSTDTENYVARVHNHYLPKEEVARALKDNAMVDSALFVQNYINSWATERLLLDGALRNTDKQAQEKFNTLVEHYKNDLYTKYYKDVLISQQLDTLVSDEEARKFYEQNKENFNLNESLVQIKYVLVNGDYTRLNQLKKYFTGTTIADKTALDSLRFQFKDEFLNDSLWVREQTVIQRIGPITTDNAERMLKKTNFLQLRDSLGLYLIAVKNRLQRNDIAPLQHVRPTIDQIIRNRRKLALTKKLEKEIKDDAIKNKQFEIYK